MDSHVSAPTTSSVPGSRSWSRVLAAGLALFALWCLLFRNLIVDDAFIYFRFAENLRRGHGWVWNPGQSPVEGVASPLWTALLLPLARWPDGIYTASKIFGVVLALGTIILASRAAHMLAGPLAARITALLLLLSPLLAFHAMSGMDTALSTFAVAGLSLLTVQLAMRPPGEMRWGSAVRFGAIWWLCSLVRLEIALFGALACTLLYARFETRGRRALQGGVLLGAILPAAVTLLVRYVYFGALLPLPFHVKHAAPGPTAMGIGYVALFVRRAPLGRDSSSSCSPLAGGRARGPTDVSPGRPRPKRRSSFPLPPAHSPTPSPIP